MQYVVFHAVRTVTAVLSCYVLQESCQIGILPNRDFVHRPNLLPKQIAYGGLKN